MPARNQKLLTFLREHARVSEASVLQYEARIRNISTNLYKTELPKAIKELATSFYAFGVFGHDTQAEICKKLGISDSTFERLEKAIPRAWPKVYNYTFRDQVLYTELFKEELKTALFKERQASARVAVNPRVRKPLLTRKSLATAPAASECTSAPIGILDSLSRIEKKLDRLHQRLDFKKEWEELEVPPGKFYPEFKASLNQSPNQVNNGAIND